MGFIYKIINKTNDKIYIGQTINTVEYRLNQHYREAKSEKKLGKTSSYFHNALNKYGLENFRYEILEETPNEKLSEREIYWIKELNATNRDIGYNIGEGGETASTSPEVRKKIGESTKQRWENDPVAAEAMRNGLAKATKVWQEKSKAARTVKQCLICETEFEVANWDKDKKYCSVDCSKKDRNTWMNCEPGLKAATIANQQSKGERYTLINDLVLKWTIENADFVLKIPFNRITPNLQEITEIVRQEVGVSDARVIANAVCGKSSRKELLTFLQNYVKMYAVPDQN